MARDLIIRLQARVLARVEAARLRKEAEASVVETETDDTDVVDWEDYDVLPKQAPARAPERLARLDWGCRIGRQPRHGAKTPRAKTAHRGQTRG